MITVNGIVKMFDSETVLDHLSLEVPRGELFAILGPNGCGKTTLLKCLAGLYVPIEGTITIDGLDRRRDHLAIRRFVSWLPDQPFLYTNFTGEGWLKMVASFYEIDEPKSRKQIGELLDIFDLKSLGSKRITHYSNGQYKKLAICGALITNARLYIFDEPFTGEIDPPGVAALKEILRAMAKRDDITCVFSTQMVDQAEQLAERVGVLHNGRFAAVGTAAELRERYDARSLEEVLTTICNKRPSETTKSFLETLARF